LKRQLFAIRPRWFDGRFQRINSSKQAFGVRVRTKEVSGFLKGLDLFMMTLPISPFHSRQRIFQWPLIPPHSQKKVRLGKLPRPARWQRALPGF
jgi:hypothetical protein